MEFKNFTTFATPHLGVRSPARGFKAFVWNVMASRSLSISGREMFAIDTFRDTGRPVLAVLADPESIFMTGLERFQRRTLYSNITNDMNTDYYTTSIQRSDPFGDLQGRTANYLDGYDSVMLNPVEPLLPRHEGQLQTTEPVSRLGWLRQIPFFAVLPLYAPLFVTACFVYSCVETTRSSFRISRHESGLAGISVEKYRALSFLVEDARRNDAGQTRPDTLLASRGYSKSWAEVIAELQPLSLDSHQHAMLNGLDTLDWRRYPVWIRKKDKAHEAINVNSDHADYEEGRIVLGHFVNDEFLV